MTERLYYTDPTILQFSAKIISLEKKDNDYHTILDRSAFYPTSGGQFHDRGMLNNVTVNDVILDKDSNVIHISHEPTGDVGQEVSGAVDPVRRSDNRQKHTAQHIISQAFVQLYQLETVSVHLGDEYAAIELGGPEVTPEQMTKAESLANQIIAENHPIKISFLSQAEVKKLPVRKIPDREGVIRIIQIGEFDYSACGGTHCCHSAEVQLLKLIGSEKARGNTLIKFLAGRLAFEDYSARFDITNGLANEFTCHYGDLPDKLRKIDSENRSLRKEVLTLNKELTPVKAKALAEKSQPCGKYNFLFETVSVADPKLLNALATATVLESGGIQFLLNNDRMIISVGKESEIKAGDIARQMVEKFSLKGGGSPVQAQLAGLDLNKIGEYRTFLWEVVESA